MLCVLLITIDLAYLFSALKIGKKLVSDAANALARAFGTA